MSPTEMDEPREVYCGPDEEFTVSNLLPGTTYSFRLRAANAAGVRRECRHKQSVGMPMVSQMYIKE